MKKGFSLTEVLTTIVILAALAAIAVPGFSKATQKADANQAITYLRVIRLAEKMHFAKNGSYSTLPPAGCTAMTAMANAAAINTCLGTEIAAGKFTFSVSAPTTTTFTATATRTSPAATITLNQDGAWGGTYTPLPTS